MQTLINKSLLLRKICFALVCSLGVGGSALHAATVTWDAGGVPDLNWITDTFGNWSDDTDPTGNDVAFSLIGSTADPSGVTNIVNESTSIHSLLYQYDGASSYQVTEIATGETLNVGGTTNTLTVGGYTGTDVRTTKTVFTGSGALQINQAGGQVFIGNNRNTTGDQSVTILDMHALSAAHVALDAGGSFNVGTSAFDEAVGNQRSLSTVFLADSNHITAGELNVASVVHTGNINLAAQDSPVTTLYLGRENTIHVDAIHIGVASNSTVKGMLAFDPSVLGSSPSVFIRGSDGSGVVEHLYIGVNEPAGGHNSSLQYGNVDFSGGEVDMRVTDLLVASTGRANTNPTAHAEGSLTMDAGEIIISSGVLGKSAIQGATGSGTTTAALNVLGGSFQATSLVLAESLSAISANVHRLSSTLRIDNDGAVSVANGIVMGRHGGAANEAPLTTTIHLDGGILTVQGNIAEGLSGNGGITSTINLRGGILDMNGNSVSVDHFNAESGELRNLAQLNGGGNLQKTTNGTLVVEGVNTYTGQTFIDAGTLVVNGSHSAGGAYVINDGGVLGGSGTIETADANITLAAGGKLSPGNSPGELTLDLGTGTLDISSGVAASSSEALIFELGAGSDQITLSGTLNIGSDVLEFDDFVFLDIAGFAPGTYTLFGTDRLISGTLGDSLTGWVGGYESTLELANGGFDLVLNVVPEPSAAWLFLAGGLFWVAAAGFQRWHRTPIILNPAVENYHGGHEGNEG